MIICDIIVFYEILKKISVIVDFFLVIVFVFVIFFCIILIKIFFLIDEVLMLNMILVFLKNVLNSYIGYCICYDVIYKFINFILFKDIVDILFIV